MSLSANSCILQFSCPSGASLQAFWTNRVSAAPSSTLLFVFLGWVWFIVAASTPINTHDDTFLAGSFDCATTGLQSFDSAPSFVVVSLSSTICHQLRSDLPITIYLVDLSMPIQPIQHHLNTTSSQRNAGIGRTIV